MRRISLGIIMLAAMSGAILLAQVAQATTEAGPNLPVAAVQAQGDPNAGVPDALTVQAKSVPPTANERAQAAIVKPKGFQSVRKSTAVPFVCYDTGGPGLAVVWSSTWTPYASQRVYEHRHWCGYLNWYQTSRSSDVSLGGGPLCSWDNPREWKVGGGNGYASTDVESAGHFNCTIPKVGLFNYQDAMIWRCNMGGYCNFLWSGRL